MIKSLSLSDAAFHQSQSTSWKLVDGGKGVDQGEEDQQDSNIEVGLPEDVVELIHAACINQYNIRDIIRSSILCKRWYSVASSRTKARPPWLMLADNSLDQIRKNRYIRFVSLWGKEDSNKFNLYDIGVRTTSVHPVISCGWVFLLSSPGGWLLYGCRCCHPQRSTLYANHHRLGLYNPFRKVCIHLPTYAPPSLGCGCSSRNCARNPGRCLVFFSTQFRCNMVVLLFVGSNLSICKLDNINHFHKRWFYHHNPRHTLYSDVWFHEDDQCLYVIDNRGVLDVFAVVNNCYGDGQDALTMQLVKSERLSLGGFGYFTCFLRLLESCGEILVVASNNMLNFRVYSLFSDMKRMKSLGGQALFLHFGGPSSSISAKELPKVDEDCIYIPDQERVLVFSLKDDSTISIYYSHTPLGDYLDNSEVGNLITSPSLF